MNNLELFHYLASISYNGKEYFGFQTQKNEKSIQKEIENVIYILNKKYIDIYKDNNQNQIKELLRIRFAGRTDAKVHALENLISFSIIKNFSPDKLKVIFNNNLPKSIRFNKIIQTKNKINPRYEAFERTYLYIIYRGTKYIPFIQDYSFVYNDFLDTEKLGQSLSLFIGTHNFVNFTTTLEKRNPIRTIYDTKIIEKDDFIYILISGNSFLHKQVRLMIGTSLMFSKGKILLEEIKSLLIQDPQNKIYTKNINKIKNIYSVPPEGLYLAKVRLKGFENDFDENIFFI